MSYYLDQAKGWIRAGESDWAAGYQKVATRKATFAIANAMIVVAEQLIRANKVSLVLPDEMVQINEDGEDDD